MRAELEKVPAELWIWEQNGEKIRARMEVVLGSKVIKKHPWSKWVKFPTPINKGYWKK